jgi:hypothetical protein
MFRLLLLTVVCGAQIVSEPAATGTSASYSIVADSIDSGGTEASSANYINSGGLGGISGFATVALPAETIKSGYVGQLYQVTGLGLTSIFVDNGTTQQLSATQTLDDGTTLALSGDSQLWSVVAGQIPAGLTLNMSKGVISGIPIKSGGYAFTILVNDGLGNSAQQAFSGTTQMTFSQWEARYFNATQIANSGISGPTVILENDGIANLYKYLFDINPAEVMTTADLAALPVVGTTINKGILYLTLTCRENSSASGITVNIQTSSDLQSWQTVTPDFTVPVGIDSITGDPIVEFEVSIAGSTRKFINLQVTSP